MKMNNLSVILLAAGAAGIAYFLWNRGNVAMAQSLGFQNAYNAVASNFTKLYNNSPDAAKILAQ
jgi:hypothetical protein